MQQVELKSLVSDLKSDFSKSTRINRKTVADRANMANVAALEMLSDTVAEKNTNTFLERARNLRSLNSELNEITNILEDLGSRSQKG